MAVVIRDLGYIKGPKGDPGEGIRLIGAFDNFDQLELWSDTNSYVPQGGDAAAIGGNLWIFNDPAGWKDAGKLIQSAGDLHVDGSVPSVDDLDSIENPTPGMSYIVNGHLYIYTVDSSGNGSWVDAGSIKPSSLGLAEDDTERFFSLTESAEDDLQILKAKTTAFTETEDNSNVLYLTDYENLEISDHPENELIKILVEEHNVPMSVVSKAISNIHYDTDIPYSLKMIDGNHNQFLNKILSYSNPECPDNNLVIVCINNVNSTMYGFCVFMIPAPKNDSATLASMSVTDVVMETSSSTNITWSISLTEVTETEIPVTIIPLDSLITTDNIKRESNTDGYIYVDEDGFLKGSVGSGSEEPAQVWYDERTPGQLYKSDEAPTSSDVGKFDGYLYATRVYNAVWNDYAELFEAGEDLEAGHIAYIHDDGLVYASGTPWQAIGIVSDCYGHLLGGNGDPNDRGYAAVSLAGRVPLEVEGNHTVGDFVYPRRDGKGSCSDEQPICLGRCVGNDPKGREGYIYVLVGGSR